MHAQLGLRLAHLSEGSTGIWGGDKPIRPSMEIAGFPLPALAPSAWEFYLSLRTLSYATAAASRSFANSGKGWRLRG